MKNVKWQMLLFQAVFLLTTELVLNSVAFDDSSQDADDLADYSEYLMQKHLLSTLNQKRVTSNFIHQV